MNTQPVSRVEGYARRVLLRVSLGWVLVPGLILAWAAVIALGLLAGHLIAWAVLA